MGSRTREEYEKQVHQLRRLTYIERETALEVASSIRELVEERERLQKTLNNHLESESRETMRANQMKCERDEALADAQDARKMLTDINTLLPVKGGAPYGRSIIEAVDESLMELSIAHDIAKQVEAALRHDLERAEEDREHNARGMEAAQAKLAKLREACIYANPLSKEMRCLLCERRTPIYLTTVDGRHAQHAPTCPLLACDDAKEGSLCK